MVLTQESDQVERQVVPLTDRMVDFTRRLGRKGRDPTATAMFKDPEWQADPLPYSGDPVATV